LGSPVLCKVYCTTVYWVPSNQPTGSVLITSVQLFTLKPQTNLPGLYCFQVYTVYCKPAYRFCTVYKCTTVYWVTSNPTKGYALCTSVRCVLCNLQQTYTVCTAYKSTTVYWLTNQKCTAVNCITSNRLTGSVLCPLILSW